VSDILWRRSLGDVRSRNGRLVLGACGAAAGGLLAAVAAPDPQVLVLWSAVLAGVMASWSP